MKGLTLPILLQLVSVVVLIADFIVPSFGVLSVTALGLIVWALVQTFSSAGNSAGMIMLGADVVVLPLVVLFGFKILARSPFALKSTLSSAEGVSSQSATLAALAGKSGTVISPLRPAGMALIEGHRIDVVSKGEFIDKDVNVTVIVVTGNQVIVKQSAPESEAINAA